MLLGIAWLVLIDSTFNGGFDEAVRWLWAPWLVVVVAYAWRYWGWMRERTRRWSSWKLPLLVVAMHPMLILMSWPHLMAINASGDRGLGVYEGALQHKWISRGRSSTSNILTFTDAASRRTVDAQVSQELYDSAGIGAMVHCEYRIGTLGIAYRWRYGEDKPACTLARK